MPAYNFQKQFVPMIVDGQKPHTIRKRRKHPTKVGDVLMLFTGMRTKSCRQFAEAVCVKVEPVVIWVDIKALTKSYTGQAFSKEKVKEIALNDGFDSVDSFFAFFELYKLGVLDDYEIIHWDPKTLKALEVRDAKS